MLSKNLNNLKSLRMSHFQPVLIYWGACHLRYIYFILFDFSCFVFFLFIVTWLTAPPVRKSPPSCNWVSLLFLKTSYYIIYVKYISIYIHIYINKNSHNECSEQKWISQTYKTRTVVCKKDCTVHFLTDCCFYSFAFSFTLRCLHWKRSRFLTRACDSSLQYCKCLRIEPMGWAAIFVSRKMAQT